MRAPFTFHLAPALVAAATMTLATSCETYTGTGTLSGAAAGALIGAVAGDDEKDITQGAIAGAVLGGAAGVYADNRAKRYDPANYPTFGGDGPAAPYSQPSPTPSYPLGTPTQLPHEVVSPWPPHGVVDVSGFRHGEIVEDPHTSKPFRIP